MSETTLSAEPVRRRRRRPEVVIEAAVPPVAVPDEMPDEVPAVVEPAVEPAGEPSLFEPAAVEPAPATEPEPAGEAEAVVEPEPAAEPEAVVEEADAPVEAAVVEEADAPAEAADGPEPPAGLDRADGPELLDRRCMETWDVEPAVALPVAAPERPAPAPRRARKRSLALAGAALVVGGAVSAAFALAGPASGDESFVAAARDAGAHVAPGLQQQLLVSAARKICERRVLHTSVVDRQATALSTDELRAIGQAFHGDPRGFTSLALETYCSD